MKVYTDSISCAEKILGENPGWRESSLHSENSDIQILSKNLYSEEAISECEVHFHSLWKYLFLVKSAAGSQYDVLRKLTQKENSLPGGILCMAESGKGFHGFEGIRRIDTFVLLTFILKICIIYVQ